MTKLELSKLKPGTILFTKFGCKLMTISKIQPIGKNDDLCPESEKIIFMFDFEENKIIRLLLLNKWWKYFTKVF